LIVKFTTLSSLGPSHPVDFRAILTYALVHSSTASLQSSPIVDDDDDDKLMNDDQLLTTNSFNAPFASYTTPFEHWKMSTTYLHNYLTILTLKPLASQLSKTQPTICHHHYHALNCSMPVHHSTFLRGHHLLHQTLQQAPSRAQHINPHLRSNVVCVLYLGQCPLSTILPQQSYPVHPPNLQQQKQQFPTGQNQPYHLLPPI